MFSNILFKYPLLTAAVGSSFVATLVYADQRYTVESVAAEVAKQMNQNAHKYLDDITTSMDAGSNGKNVILTYTLKLKSDLSSEKLKELERALIEDIVPKTCLQNANNVAFQKGLYYTFIYHGGGQRVSQFSVDKNRCAALNH